MAGRLIQAAIAFEATGDGVERQGPSKAPSAFRIWQAGLNQTDMGAHDFTEKSARALVEQQARRGVLFSIDVDHMSLNETSPPESRKAVGWHRLAIRDGASGPELWAVDVEWTDTVRAGLEKDPPEWRYFSPAYRLGKDTNEIASYVNTALTNNPATHFVTALANTKGASAMAEEENKEKKGEGAEAPMKLEDVLAALMGDDEGKKEAAKKCMSDAYAKAYAPNEDGEEKASEGEEKASEEKEEKKEEREEMSVALGEVKDLVRDLGREFHVLKDSVAAREKRDRKAEEDQRRTAILAKRPDLTGAVLSTIAYVPTDKLEAELAKYPRARSSVRASVNANMAGGVVTGGESNKRSDLSVARLTTDERSVFANVFGRPDPRATDVVRATQLGTQLRMPEFFPSDKQVENRIAELRTELAALREEMI